jgi:hypothetical protein
MLSYAARRGVRVVEGVAEALPFREAAFEFPLQQAAAFGLIAPRHP